MAFCELSTGFLGLHFHEEVRALVPQIGKANGGSVRFRQSEVSNS
jgi:hypothetical protein